MVAWADVSKNIIENDMDKADEAKKMVEQQQRDRIAEKRKQGTENEGKFFELTEQGWVFKKKSEIENSFKKEKKTRKKQISEETVVVPQPSAEKKEEKKIVVPVQPLPSQPKPELKVELPEDESSESAFSLGTTSDSEDEKIEPKRSLRDSYTGSSGTASQNSSRPTSLSKMQTSPLPKREEKDKPTAPTISSAISAKDPKRGSLTATINLSDDANILTGWVKMRNSMKIWNQRWFVLRPGKLIYYKDEKVCHGDVNSSWNRICIKTDVWAY